MDNFRRLTFVIEQFKPRIEMTKERHFKHIEKKYIIESKWNHQWNLLVLYAIAVHVWASCLNKLFHYDFFKHDPLLLCDSPKISLEAFFLKYPNKANSWLKQQSIFSHSYIRPVINWVSQAYQRIVTQGIVLDQVDSHILEFRRNACSQLCCYILPVILLRSFPRFFYVELKIEFKLNSVQ
jgi:hypothetical protein